MRALAGIEPDGLGTVEIAVAKGTGFDFEDFGFLGKGVGSARGVFGQRFAAGGMDNGGRGSDFRL